MTDLFIKKVRSLGDVGVADRPLTIGRGSDNSIVLPDNKVSRHHCIIERVNGTARVRDLESHFGTFVNGDRITEQELAEGDVITVGPYDLNFGALPEPHRGPAPPSTPAEENVAVIETIAAERATLEAERATLAAERATLAERNRHLETQQRVATTFDELERTLQTREESLDAERQRLATLAEHLAERERALGEEQERLAAAPPVADEGIDPRRHELDEREQSLADLEREVAQQRDILEERTRAMETAEEAHRAKLAALDREEQAVAQERSALETLRTTLDASERRLRDEETLRGDTLAAIEAELQAVRSEAQSQREIAASLERELGVVREALETRADAAERERSQLLAQIEKTDSNGTETADLHALQLAVEDIREAANHVAATRRAVRALEAMWLETDELIDNSERSGRVDPNSVMRRDAIAEQLADAHEARDAALIQLERLVDRIGIQG